MSDAKTLDPYHRWLGIPPKDQPPTHYRLLGIDPLESDPEVIRDAAAQRMAHVRTYQLGQYTELSQKILNELAAAKACLLDPQKKAVYDRHLRTTAGTAEALKKPVDSRPVSGPTRPAPAKPAARSLPRWLAPSLAGGIALLLAGVGAAVVLTRNRGGNEVVRAPDSAKPVDTASAGRTASKLAGQTPKLPAPEAASSPAAIQPGAHPAAPPLVRPPKPAAPPPQTPRPPPTWTVEEAKSPSDQPYSPAGKTVKKPPKTKKGTRGRPGTPNNTLGSASRDVHRWLPIALPSPSHAAVTETMLSLPRNWQDTFFPKTANVFPSFDNNGRLLGVFNHTGVKLQGAAATLHPNGRLETLANAYSKGILEGCVKLWDAEGKQVLYAEYQHGKKHGVLCFFQNGIPWLVQECDKGQPQNEYLVQWTGGGPRLLSTAERSDATAEASAAKQQLADLEHTMKNREKQYRKNLANSIAGMANKSKLSNSLGRIHARGAASAAADNAFWRTALKRAAL